MFFFFINLNFDYYSVESWLAYLVRAEIVDKAGQHGFLADFDGYVFDRFVEWGHHEAIVVVMRIEFDHVRTCQLVQQYR